MGLPNIPDGGYDPADIPDDDDEEEFEDDDPTYVESSDWEAVTERYWYPGPK